MIKVVDECVCCDMPCVNCGRKHTVRTYCDECGTDDILRYVDDRMLCADCIMDLFPVVEESVY